MALRIENSLQNSATVQSFTAPVTSRRVDTYSISTLRTGPAAAPTTAAPAPATGAPAAQDTASGCCGITAFFSRIFSSISDCFSGMWNKVLGWFGRAPAAAPAPAPAAPAVTPAKDPLEDFIAVYSAQNGNYQKAWRALSQDDRKAVAERMKDNCENAAEAKKTVAYFRTKAEGNLRAKSVKDAVQSLIDERKKAAADAAAKAAAAAPAAPNA